MTFAKRHYPVIVVGGGQAGLSTSYLLQQRHIEHLVLEKEEAFHAWKNQRWDSFCLVTPNWQCRLPDFPYKGDQPDGFMGKASIVDYLQRFAKHVNADLREGVTVSIRWNTVGSSTVGSRRSTSGSICCTAPSLRRGITIEVEVLTV